MIEKLNGSEPLIGEAPNSLLRKLNEMIDAINRIELEVDKLRGDFFIHKVLK